MGRKRSRNGGGDGGGDGGDGGGGCVQSRLKDDANWERVECDAERLGFSEGGFLSLEVLSAEDLNTVLVDDGGGSGATKGGGGKRSKKSLSVASKADHLDADGWTSLIEQFESGTEYRVACGDEAPPSSEPDANDVEMEAWVQAKVQAREKVEERESVVKEGEEEGKKKKVQPKKKKKRKQVEEKAGDDGEDKRPKKEEVVVTEEMKQKPHPKDAQKKRKKRALKRKRQAALKRGEVWVPPSTTVTAPAKAAKAVSISNTIEVQDPEQIRKEMAEWDGGYELHPALLHGLYSLGFKEPTEIQKSVIPLALMNRTDVYGAAHTGSGKTLAFAIPIIQQIIEMEERNAKKGEDEEKEERGPCALILAPTRELAQQVSQHIIAVTRHIVLPSSTSTSKKATISKTPILTTSSSALKVVTLVGGMAVQKQTRVLSYEPHIIVATPGRLWELIEKGTPFLVKISRGLPFLVLDEADRMVEQGHYKELDSIFSILPEYIGVKTKQDNLRKEALKQQQKKNKNKRRNNNKKPEKKKASHEEIPPSEIHRQTFIFSATLSMVIANKGRGSDAAASANARASTSESDTLDRLMERLKFERRVEMVDLTASQKVVNTLHEAKIDCLPNEKDFYLACFLQRYEGRTLVFVNSIDGVRRLLPLLALLGYSAYGLHAQMQQRQRIKALQRFTNATDPNDEVDGEDDDDDNDVVAKKRGPLKRETGVGKACILVATDVAARGLDIPKLDHVIHYSLPRTAELYVHRSGRTARARCSGMSLMLISPDERKMYYRIMKTVANGDELPEFPLDTSLLAPIRMRVKLARKIDILAHRQRKAEQEKSWFQRQADACDLDLDENFKADDSGEESNTDRRDRLRKERDLANLRMKLKVLLSKPLVEKGASSLYITKSGMLPATSTSVSTPMITEDDDGGDDNNKDGASASAELLSGSAHAQRRHKRRRKLGERIN